MKWFKSFTDAPDQLFMKEIKDEFGAEGYGAYTLLVNFFCRHFNSGNEWKMEYEFSFEIWQQEVFWSFSRKKTEKFLEILRRFDQLTYGKRTANHKHYYSIKLSNLLYLIDEYTQKAYRAASKVSGLTPDSSEEREEREERDNIINKDFLSEKTDDPPSAGFTQQSKSIALDFYEMMGINQNDLAKRERRRDFEAIGSRLKTMVGSGRPIDEAKLCCIEIVKAAQYAKQEHNASITVQSLFAVNEKYSVFSKYAAKLIDGKFNKPEEQPHGNTTASSFETPLQRLEREQNQFNSGKVYENVCG